MIATADLAHLCSVRITGTLERDAVARMTSGRDPHLLLEMHLQPPQGLPYLVVQDIGPDVGDQMLATPLINLLRRGALVSAACANLKLQHDHGRPVLRAADVTVVLIHLPKTTPTEH